MPRSTEARIFDWQGGYDRLAAVEAALEAVAHPPPDMVKEILLKRAKTIAAPKKEAKPAITIDLVSLGFRGRQFAVEVEQIDAIIGLGNMLTVPDLPALYLGLIYSRGDIYPVIDVTLLFGMAPGDAGQPTHAILVAHDDQAIAIAADGVGGLSQVDRSKIAPPEEDAASHPAIRGFMADGAIVFDARQLLLDTRLCVDVEPATRGRNGGT